MSSSLGASTSGRNTNSYKEGEEYEKLSLVLLAERGYKLSKDVNSQFRNFAVGREVGIGDNKLDDIVFRYDDKDSKKHLIFVQIKHKQNESLKINSQILSGSSSGHWGRDFNLRKYFISYLSIREELKTTKFKELESGKINYVVIFTNADIDKDELKGKGFKCEEAPDDIKNLFTLKKSLIGSGKFTPCYQLGSDCNYLQNFFKKCSDLHRIAKQFMHVVFDKNYIMKTDKAPLKQYHVALETEVIDKSPEVKEMEDQDQLYCDAKFRKDFLDNKESGGKKELLDAIFEAIREKSRKNDSDDDLKKVLEKAEWKIVPHFGHYLPKDEQTRIGKKLAKYVTDEKVRKNIILGKKESPMTHYEVAFQREVIEISDEVKYKSSNVQNSKSESYCDAKFRKEFIDNRDCGPKFELRKAIFDEIRKFDKSKENASDCELKNILREVELKVDKNFGKIQTLKEALPAKWPTITDNDIKDFLKCFVLFAKQPDVADLITEICPLKESFLEGPRLGEVICKLHQKFKDRIEKALGIHNKGSNEESWLTGHQIEQFVQELQDTIYTCVLTLRYEDKIFQYGSFNTLGNLKTALNSFF